MVMYKILYAMFIVANVVAMVVTCASYATTIVAKKKISTLASAKIAFPVFTEVHSLVKHCFWSGTIFAVLNWLLCSSSAAKVKKKVYADLPDTMMKMAMVWAILIFISIVVEIVIKLIKTSSDKSFSVAAGIKSCIVYSVLYFVFSFLIA